MSTLIYLKMDRVDKAEQTVKVSLDAWQGGHQALFAKEGIRALYFPRRASGSLITK